MGNDAVTGALNMPSFGAAYAKTLQEGNLPFIALWYIDIRNYRSINPKFGFLKGNEVLLAMVNGIRDILSKDLPIARLGADRFILLSAGLDFETATAAFEKLVDLLNAQMKSSGIVHHFSLSGGIYYLREPDFQSKNFSRALDYASVAHRNAKQNPHGGLVMFTEEDLERDQRRITIEQSIDTALEERQIEVWYQPQIDYSFGEVIGAEALARWNHPTLGWISPAEFIPVLENCGKIHELDLYIWEEACRNAGRWRSASDGKPVPISVNVSRAEMFESGLLEHFLQLQAKYDLPPGSLHIEVTESAFVEEADRLYRVIEEMRNNNLPVEMDDFGSGLSSLNMLKDVPVDVVKLDMGFMRSAVNEDRGGVVLGSVIRMLQGLDTPIIAEGVETREQAEMLKNMGCHLMQGFHFSRPMPLEEFESYISSTTTEDSAVRRKRKDSHLDELMSFNSSSSYLFNNAIGGTMFFFAGDGTSESILVNDDFYKECGLLRTDFGNAKINPIQEIDPESRATLWRAAAEAREAGAAICKAQVRLTGRWIECVMRYLGASARGDVYSLNIVRSGKLMEEGGLSDEQRARDAEWTFDLLDKITPNGFVKCQLDDDLSIDYISPKLMQALDFSSEEFGRRFHNSFAECIVLSDRSTVLEMVREHVRSGGVVGSHLHLHRGFNADVPARMYGRVEADAGGNLWLYAVLLLVEDMKGTPTGIATREKVIPFDYEIATDRLVVRDPQPDGSVREITIDHWFDKLEKLPDNISKTSASKVLATVRDLRHHPSSGFCDLKCNLRGGAEMRWYHVNYTCDSDETGDATVIHGYAQDANDQMSSAKWWRRQAEIDQLTGLLNRNAVEQEINLSIRTAGGGMMLMIDLDEFKRVNDNLGHLVGDALLRDVATTLGQHFREADLLGRYGGDEFVAFMPLVTRDARRIAEKRAGDIIRSISQIEIPDGTHAQCSVGVSICHEREATFYDLLEVADNALYKSKLAGKATFTILEM